jgi:dienelactone hydrolase
LTLTFIGLLSTAGGAFPTRSHAAGNPDGDGAGIEGGGSVLTFEFAHYWVDEDEDAVEIGIVRGGVADRAVAVSVNSIDGSAQAGLDYVQVTNRLWFGPGERVKRFLVPILRDGLTEADESFQLVLGSPTEGGELSPPSATTVLIRDNDPGVRFRQRELWVRLADKVAALTVERGNDVALGPFTVDVATQNGTAVGGLDYVPTFGTLTFAAEERTRSVTIPLLDHSPVRPDRTFRVTLSHPMGAVRLSGPADVTADVTVGDTREMRPHRFSSLDLLPGGEVQLTLEGGFTPGLGLSNRFQPFFDLFPVEVSSNLVDWQPLARLVRTNAATNHLVLSDRPVCDWTTRFYRTPVDPLVAPQRVPSGPYPVGVIDRTVRDDSRRNRFRVSTNALFPITIWYPAAPRAGQWPAAYAPESQTAAPRNWAGWLDRAPWFHRHAVADAPWADGTTRFPLVLCSHGWLDYRSDWQELAEHLASHGFVVVSVDHADSSVVLYPDGRYIYNHWQDTVGREMNDWLLQDRVRDLSVVLDTLEVWNQGDDRLAGRLDTQQVAAMGCSFGGPTAGEFGRREDRCRAVVALDLAGYIPPSLATAGLQKPSLTIHRGDYADDTLFRHAAGDAWWFQLRDIVHADFRTYYCLGIDTPLDRGREAARTIVDFILWFLNQFLKQSTDPMPVPSNYPELINFRTK